MTNSQQSTYGQEVLRLAKAMSALSTAACDRGTTEEQFDALEREHRNADRALARATAKLQAEQA